MEPGSFLRPLYALYMFRLAEVISGRFAGERGAFSNRKVSKKETLDFSRIESWLAQLNTRLRGQFETKVSNKSTAWLV